MKKDDHKVLTAFTRAENVVRYYRENGLRKTASKIYSTLCKRREASQRIEIPSSHEKQEYAPLSDQIFVSLCNDKLIGENKFKDQLETQYAIQMILGIINTIPEPRRTECLRDVVS